MGRHPQQMLRLAEDARCIIKGGISQVHATGETCAQVQATVGLSAPLDTAALMLTPSTQDFGDPTYITHWNAYTNLAGAAAAADAIAFHTYSHNGTRVQLAENSFTDFNTFWGNMINSAIKTKPFYSTEGNYGGWSNLPDLDMEAGYTAKYFLLLQSLGFQKIYLYGYDYTSASGGGEGGLWIKNGDTYGGSGGGAFTCTESVLDQGCLLKDGLAYNTVAQWLIGATLTSPCSILSGSVWTCGYTLADGVSAKAVWDASQTCSGGNCTTSSYPPTGNLGAQWTQYTDVYGNVTQIAGGTTHINIDYRPILLRAGVVGVYSLTANNAGTGTGTELSSPSGIDCPSACVATYAAGTAVDITASPNSGSTFNAVGGWTGCDSNPSQYVCHVVLNSNRTITATFTLSSGGGLYSQSNRPPASFYPYPLSNSLWTQRIPSDATSHDLVPGNYGLTGSYSAMVNCAITGCGYGAGFNDPYGPLRIYINSSASDGTAATNDMGKPLYLPASTDVFYRAHGDGNHGSECYYETNVDFVFHAPNQAQFSGWGQYNDSFMEIYDQTLGLFVSFSRGGTNGQMALPNCTSHDINAPCDIGTTVGASSCVAQRAGTDKDWGWQVTSTENVTVGGRAMVLGGSGDNIGWGAAGAMAYTRFEEIMGGINHAIQANLLCVNNGGFIFPAHSGALLCSQSSIQPPTPENWPPAGALIYLALSDDQINAMNLPPLQKNILQQNAHYGFYVSVTGLAGPTSPIAGDSVDSEQSWCMFFGCNSSISSHHPIFAWLQGQKLGSPNSDAGVAQLTMSLGANSPHLPEFRMSYSMLYGIPPVAGHNILYYYHIADPCLVKRMQNQAQPGSITGAC